MKYNHTDLKALIPTITHLIVRTEDKELLAVWQEFGKKFEEHDEYSKPAEFALTVVQVLKWFSGIAIAAVTLAKLFNII
jgi:hypothetical protein